MSEAAQLLAGGGAATPPPATDTPTPPPAAEGAAVPPATPSADAPWYGSIEDAELKGYAENKGFKDPAAALNSMRNLEKLNGGDKVAMPKDGEDKEAWNKVYDKLGRPATPADYQLPTAEGDDGVFAGEAGKWMHEAGLNTTQARALAEKWNAHAAGLQGESETERAISSEKEIADLKKEWGSNYSANLEISERVTREFDIPRGDIDSVLGGNEAALARILKKVGDGMLESKYVEGDGNLSFTQTAAGAQAEITSLRSDKDFMAKYQKGDPMAKHKMDSLYKKTTKV